MPIDTLEVRYPANRRKAGKVKVIQGSSRQRDGALCRSTGSLKAGGRRSASSLRGGSQTSASPLRGAEEVPLLEGGAKRCPCRAELVPLRAPPHSVLPASPSGTRRPSAAAVLNPSRCGLCPSRRQQQQHLLLLLQLSRRRPRLSPPQG